MQIHELENDSGPSHSAQPSHPPQLLPSQHSRPTHIAGGFSIISASSSPPPTPETLTTLTDQVAQVKLKRKADDSRDSPLAKRNKSHERSSPVSAERTLRANLLNDQNLTWNRRNNHSPSQPYFSHANKSPTDLRKQYNGYDLIFNVGTSSSVSNRRKFSLSRPRRVLFPPLEESPHFPSGNSSDDTQRGGGWPSPATNPQ